MVSPPAHRAKGLRTRHVAWEGLADDQPQVGRWGRQASQKGGVGQYWQKTGVPVPIVTSILCRVACPLSAHHMSNNYRAFFAMDGSNLLLLLLLQSTCCCD